MKNDDITAEVRNKMKINNEEGKRKSISFSTITKNLQVKIAEKMDFFSQVEFEMSSKNSKDIVHCTTNKVVYNFKSVLVYKTHLACLTKLPLDCPLKSNASQEVWVDWDKLSNGEWLPRFSTSIFYLEDAAVHPFKEFCEKIEFDSKEVAVDVKGTECPGAVVAKLLQILNITQFKCSFDCCAVLFNFPDYLRISYMDVFISKLPDEALSLLKSNILLFKEVEDHSRITTTANLFLKQWYKNERNITLFRIQGDLENDEELSIDKNILLSGIPFSTIARPTETRCSEDFTTTVVESNDAIYVIERENDKLAIVVCESKKTIQAKQFTDKKQIFDSYAALKFS